MAWLLALATLLTLLTVGFAAGASVVVIRDRRRRASRIIRVPAVVEPAEVSEAADCVQLWLDEQWNQKWGPGVSDSSGSVES